VVRAGNPVVGGVSAGWYWGFEGLDSGGLSWSQAGRVKSGWTYQVAVFETGGYELEDHIAHAGCEEGYRDALGVEQPCHFDHDGWVMASGVENC
jgi:hypothetical protein